MDLRAMDEATLPRGLDRFLGICRRAMTRVSRACWWAGLCTWLRSIKARRAHAVEALFEPLYPRSIVALLAATHQVDAAPA
jgi:hypothetical protein